MKMLVKIVTFVLVALLITGCTQSEPLPTEPVPSDIKFSAVYYSEQSYHTVDELMQDATNVFEGELTQISFAATSYPDCFGETSSQLYTVYEFKVSNSYKGWNLGTVRVGVMGGIEGYKVSEQYNTMVQAGIKQEDIKLIRTMRGFAPPTVGETYLVVAEDGGNYVNLLDILNEHQFVFSPDRENGVSDFGYEEIKEYCTSRAIPWGWIAVGICVLGAGGAACIIYLRRKKKEITGGDNL